MNGNQETKRSYEGDTYATTYSRVLSVSPKSANDYEVVLSFKPVLFEEFFFQNFPVLDIVGLTCQGTEASCHNL